MNFTRREALVGASVLAGTGILSTGAHAQSEAAQESATAAQPPSAPVCVTDFEPIARQKMAHYAYEYVTGAAGDEQTVRWNKEAYQKIRLRPSVMHDVSKLDTSVEFLGQKLEFPIILAPTAYHKAVHPDGELATARGAKTAGAAMVLSSFSTTAIEEVIKQTDRPLFFQLYVQPDRGFTRHMVERAQDAGAKAICVTVDTPVGGARNREQRANFKLPPGMDLPHLKGLNEHATGHMPATQWDIFTSILDPTVTWKDIAWLTSFAKVPVLVKGVLNPDDAEHAIQSGVKGIMVSNHGGRNLDTVPATIDALPLVIERVAGRVPVTVDGGIRRGTDIIKALALGARAVMVGRPYLYALGADGENGVATAIRILHKELQMTMALTGRTTIAQVDKNVLWPA